MSTHLYITTPQKKRYFLMLTPADETPPPHVPSTLTPQLPTPTPHK